ncbi:MAG: phosphohistidine phosphatase SixA [Leptolyngbyaceae cyanobacterium bins.349]|nr:phosphohistidine phosphatase SixA [Leptolyngbyaceae cyanobacterium bins.349]
MATGMELYLIRHGLAGEHGTYANDDERPLTAEGKQKTRQVAKRLVEFDLHFDWMLTSPLVRARQTAEILLEAGLAPQLEESVYLADGNLDGWLFWLKSWEPGSSRCLALVGHEPSLSEWAESLAFGRAIGSFQLKKAGIIGLYLPDQVAPVGRSTVFWLTPPRFLLSK